VVLLRDFFYYSRRSLHQKRHFRPGLKDPKKRKALASSQRNTSFNFLLLDGVVKKTLRSALLERDADAVKALKAQGGTLAFETKRWFIFLDAVKKGHVYIWLKLLSSS
jgi:hypothetical protein